MHSGAGAAMPYMDANDVRASYHRGSDRGGGRPVALGRGYLSGKRTRQEAFAGWPHDERPAEIAELTEPAQHLVAVHGLLGEAETGIHQHGP